MVRTFKREDGTMGVCLCDASGAWDENGHWDCKAKENIACICK